MTDTVIAVAAPVQVMVEVAAPAAVVIDVAVAGVQGPPGAGSGSGSQEVFVQDAAPVAPGPWLWVQTGLPGSGFSLWFEDGL